MPPLVVVLSALFSGGLRESVDEKMSTQNGTTAAQHTAQDLEIRHIWPDEIEDSPYQPSTRALTPEEQAEMDASVQTHGVLQPALVRPIKGKKHKGILYQLVYGHQRKYSCQRLGITLRCTVRELSDIDAAVISLVENVQRKQLTDIQEAEVTAKIMRQSEESGEPLSERGMARKMGRSVSYVRNNLALLKVKEDVRKVAERNNGVKLACLEIDKVAGEENRAPLLQAVEAGTGYREIKARVERVLSDQQHQKDSQRPPDRHTQQTQSKASKAEQEALKEFQRLFSDARAAVVAMQGWADKVPLKDREKAVDELHNYLEKLR